ncbi:MAG: hypothetical protein K1X79_04870 [Oligoflexia bacterium]|nr:hypothetical protein [Oligoflexia bacterium]
MKKQVLSVGFGILGASMFLHPVLARAELEACQDIEIEALEGMIDRGTATLLNFNPTEHFTQQVAELHPRLVNRTVDDICPPTRNAQNQIECETNGNCWLAVNEQNPDRRGACTRNFGRVNGTTVVLGCACVSVPKKPGEVAPPTPTPTPIPTTPPTAVPTTPPTPAPSRPGFFKKILPFLMPGVNVNGQSIPLLPDGSN